MLLFYNNIFSVILSSNLSILEPALSERYCDKWPAKRCYKNRHAAWIRIITISLIAQLRERWRCQACHTKNDRKCTVANKIMNVHVTSSAKHNLTSSNRQGCLRLEDGPYGPASRAWYFTLECFRKNASSCVIIRRVHGTPWIRVLDYVVLLFAICNRSLRSEQNTTITI